MIQHLLLGWIAALAADDGLLQIQLIDGRQVSAVLVQLDENGLVLATDEPTTLPLRSLAHLQLASPSETDLRKESVDTWMTLADDSHSPVAKINLKSGELSGRFLDGTNFKTPVKAVSSLRFYAPAATTNQQWESLIKRDRSGDIVIVRKSADSLDVLEGVIESIDEEVVNFVFDGQKIPVRRSKLEGVGFLRNNVQTTQPKAVLTDVFGGNWQLVDLSATPKELQIKTKSGLEWSWPLATLSRVDFSGSNVVYLSDLVPTRSQWQPFFPAATLQQEFQRLFEPRMNENFDNEPLRLVMADGRRQEFAKGLALHSRSEVVYRMPQQFERLQMVVGIGATVRNIGRVQLEIRGDDKPLWTGLIVGADAPVTLDLDLQDVSRLTIRVGYGDKLDYGDHLFLCDPRLVKSTK